MNRFLLASIALGSCVLLAGCAKTTVILSETAPQTTLCQASGESIDALVLWRPSWRPDQKDVPLREAAAEQGIERFFERSRCFSTAEIRRVPTEMTVERSQAEALAVTVDPEASRVLVLTVRELGPIVKLLASAALLEGGTEVVLNVVYYDLAPSGPSHAFDVHWANGGPWVVKGVATLPEDMQSALEVALEPGERPK